MNPTKSHPLNASDEAAWDEFVLRSGGKSYLEIAKAGGGIQRTVLAVREASRDQLVELALPRLQRGPRFTRGLRCRRR